MSHDQSATPEWREALKVGDQVTVRSSDQRWKIAKVARLTATQIILDTAERFRRSNGYRIGDSQAYVSAYIMPVRQEHRDREEYASLKRTIGYALSNDRKDRVGLEKLRAMAAILKGGAL